MAVHLITGPMFSGKTTFLLNYLNKTKPRETVLLKHLQDTRFPVRSRVVTHGGMSFPAIEVQRLKDLDNEHFETCSTIAIDEGHLFENLYETSLEWVRHGKQVIITALSNGTFMQPLTEISRLMAVADKVIALTTECSSCHARANFSFRKKAFPENENPDSPAFFIGGSEAYTPLCRRCFIKQYQHDQEHTLGMFSGPGIKALEIPMDTLTWDTRLIGRW
jgi:thymidine kinase